MCGIFGSITKGNYNLSEQDSKKRSQIITGLALAMEKRGVDSTGIAGIDQETVVLFKKALPAHKFIDTKGFNEVLSQNKKILIGHTRLATVGAISDRNAHPFSFGNITGVHNGHVSNYKSMGNDDIEVDSEAIFSLLDKYKNDYRKAFSELVGSFAVAWFDKSKPNQLNLVSDGNPIKIIYIDKIKTYFFASEEYPLSAVVGSHFLIEDKNVWTPEESKVYTINTKLQIKTHPIQFKEYSACVYPHTYPRDERDARVAYDETHYEYPEDEGYSPNFNFRKLYDVENPFKKKEKETEIIGLDAINDFMFKEMEVVLKGINETGCAYCQSRIDIQEDGCCYLYEIGDKLEDKQIICLWCRKASQLNPQNLTYIGMDEYIALEEEVEEYRDTVKMQLYVKRKKGKGQKKN